MTNDPHPIMTSGWPIRGYWDRQVAPEFSEIVFGKQNAEGVYVRQAPTPARPGCLFRVDAPPPPSWELEGGWSGRRPGI